MNCSQIISIIVSPVIGIVGVLLGVFIQSAIENRRRKKEAICRAKPIIINYPSCALPNDEFVARLEFISTAGKPAGVTIDGFFKNTDNGILFIDSVETESLVYLPKVSTAIEKDCAFVIILGNIAGETRTGCTINCHDIYGTQYYYPASFPMKEGEVSGIIIDSAMPLIKQKRKMKKQKGRSGPPDASFHTN